MERPHKVEGNRRASIPGQSRGDDWKGDDLQPVDDDLGLVCHELSQNGSGPEKLDTSLVLVRTASTARPRFQIASSSSWLTWREEQVLICLMERLSNKEIAGRLGIATSTAKTHVHHLLEKFRAKSRRELVARVRVI